MNTVYCNKLHTEVLVFSSDNRDFVFEFFFFFVEKKGLSVLNVHKIFDVEGSTLRYDFWHAKMNLDARRPRPRVKSEVFLIIINNLIVI